MERPTAIGWSASSGAHDLKTRYQESHSVEDVSFRGQRWHC